jgi:uncharacterized membrane protein YczE
MTTLLIIYIVIGVLVGVSLALTQAFHPNPWVRKQVENVYGPAFVMGFCLALFIIAQVAAP